VDFWDHWRYDLLEAPPIVRDWLPYETSWRNLLNGWLVPNDFAQGPVMPE
jgi:hypothetical protein